MNKTKIVKLGVCSLLVGLLALTACGKKTTKRSTTKVNSTTACGKTTTNKTTKTTKITTKKQTTEEKNYTVELKSFNVNTKLYDGKEANATYELTHDTEATILFKVKDADDSTYTNVAPKEVGEYTAKLVVEETDKHNGLEETKDFYILNRGIEAIGQNIQELADGLDHTLKIPNYDSEFMDLYVKGEDSNYTKVNEIVRKTGRTDFKVVLKSDSVYFNGLSETVRELEGSWTLVDFSSIVTKITRNGTEIPVSDFLATEAYELGTYSFTCKSGYTVRIIDYNGYESSIREGYYAYLQIKQDETEIYKKELVKKASYADGIKINGKSFAFTSEDIYYYLDGTEEEVVIEFINPSSDLYYELSNSYGNRKVTGPIVLTPDNELIGLWKKEGEGSYSSISKIRIIAYDPVKSLDLIRYDIANDKIITEHIIDDGSYLNSTGGNNFAVGFSVTLNEGYEDCIVRILDRETRKEADFAKFLESREYWVYLLIEIEKDGKIIYTNQVSVENRYLRLLEDTTYEVRGIEHNLLLVSNSDRKAIFSLIGGNVGAKLLLNGQEKNTKTYEADGIYREKLTFVKEILGKEYNIDFYCDVVVGDDASDFTDISCTYQEYWNDEAHNYYAEVSDNNCINYPFYVYSVEHFDVSTIKLDNSDDYSILSANLINDDENEMTYIILVISDGVGNHTLYLPVATNHELSTDLSLIGNGVEVSSIKGIEFYEVDEDDTITVPVATGDHYYYFDFRSKVHLEVIDSSNKKTDYGTESDFPNVLFKDAGTYTIKVTNRLNETKTYTFIIEDYMSVIDVTIGDDVVIYYHDEVDNNLKVDYTTYSSKTYIGEEYQSAIVDGKLELGISGYIADCLYYDKLFKNKVDINNAIFNVLLDSENNPYIEAYIKSDYGAISIIIMLANKPKGPLSLTFGDNEYSIGNEDNPGDLSMGFMGYMLTVKDPQDEFTMSVNKVYEDYTNSLVILPFMSESDFSDETISSLESNEFVYRVTDTTTLSYTFNLYKSHYYPYTILILPEGTKATDTLGDLDYFSFVLVKPAYIFNLTIDDNNYYATADTNMNNGSPILDTNASNYELSGSTYSELIFYIGEDELENITDDIYEVNFDSGLGLESEIYTTDDDSIVFSGNSLSLSVKDQDGVKYVEFKYKGSTAGVGEAVVRLIFEDEPENI